MRISRTARVLSEPHFLFDSFYTSATYIPGAPARVSLLSFPP